MNVELRGEFWLNPKEVAPDGKYFNETNWVGIESKSGSGPYRGEPVHAEGRVHIWAYDSGTYSDNHGDLFAFVY